MFLAFDPITNINGESMTLPHFADTCKLNPIMQIEIQRDTVGWIRHKYRRTAEFWSLLLECGTFESTSMELNSMAVNIIKFSFDRS